MGLDDLLHIHACLLFQIVDILRRIQQEDALILKHLDEEMSRRWVDICKVEVLREVVIGFGFVDEVVDVEQGFWCRQVVFL